MDNPRISLVEWGFLEGQRPRHQGKNARLEDHGITIRIPIARLTTEDGSSGFGICRAKPEQLSALVGLHLNDLFDEQDGVREAYFKFEYPIWDLMGQRAGKPIYQLLSRINWQTVKAEPYRVPCYDTTLYFDDLHLESHDEAADLIAQHALEGYERGHRAFKIKVGRGARHMPLEDGTVRDIKIIKAVRRAVGESAPIMIDANNGYNLNLTKRVLAETRECNLLWIEEAFHEDAVLYQDLKVWMMQNDFSVLIADGEGNADPRLVEWAYSELVDIIQYDIYDYGFTKWLHLGRKLDDYKVSLAPHHYGSHIGNYTACHLGGGVGNIMYYEWDTAEMPGLDTSGYSLSEGWMSIPDSAGFGLKLDEAIFQQAVKSSGDVYKG